MFMYIDQLTEFHERIGTMKWGRDIRCSILYTNLFFNAIFMKGLNH